MKNKPSNSNRTRSVKQSIFMILVALSATFFFQRVSAQASGQLQISNLDLNSFPTIRFTLKLQDQNGKYVSDLQTDQVQLLEDGYVQPVLELNRLRPGMQIILAVNESPSLTNQTAGISYYRRLMQTLETWSQSIQPETPDNYSYITNLGPQIVQVDPALFSQTLIAFEPDLVAARPGLTSLSMALDLATDPLPSADMKRAILYITPLPAAASREALPDLTERAVQLDASVFVWVIAPGYPLESPEITPLRQLADSTGGGLYLFTGAEDFPNPERYFETLRYIYEVVYQSGISTSGEHQLVTSIIRADMQLTSENLPFNITISPPNPIFLEPPSQIIRSFTEDEGSKTLAPQTFPVRIIIEFPDGHQRPLQATRLYINDSLVVENLTPPFDRFNIPLKPYENSAQLFLRAEVEDSLGFKQSSIETLVELVVEEPQGSWFRTLISRRGVSIMIALLVAGLVLAAVILFTSQSNILQRLNPSRLRRMQDPVTQPVAVKIKKKNRASASIPSPTVRASPAAVAATAQLLRISESGNPIPQKAIPLIHRETTLGADPDQATCVLDSTAVNPLHARIFQNSEGDFYIADCGSIAGTWVNYDAVSQEGKKLAHCDTIHFGLMAFRFELKKPTWVRKPRVRPYKTDEI